jgi:hypothetical protein
MKGSQVFNSLQKESHSEHPERLPSTVSQDSWPFSTMPYLFFNFFILDKFNRLN